MGWDQLVPSYLKCFLSSLFFLQTGMCSSELDKRERWGARSKCDHGSHGSIMGWIMTLLKSPLSPLPPQTRASPSLGTTVWREWTGEDEAPQLLLPLLQGLWEKGLGAAPSHSQVQPGCARAAPTAPSLSFIQKGTRSVYCRITTIYIFLLLFSF